MCCNGYDNCKTNKTVQRILKFKNDTWCVKGRWCSPKNTSFNKNSSFSPTLDKNVQGSATSVTGRMFYHTDIVRVCAQLSAMQVAHSWNFVKNDRFSPIILEKSTAGRGWIWITAKSEGASPKFLQKMYKTSLSIKPMQKTPKTLHRFWAGSPWKRDIQQKLQFSRPPCTNCVRGWCPRYGTLFRGFSVQPNGRSKIVIFA